MALQTLIVDDSPSFRALLGKRLEGIGCWVTGQAGTAKQGLDLIRERKPALVTLDIMMPDEPGFNAKDLFRTIRKEMPETAIVVISSAPRIPTAAEFMGAIAYLEKSFMNFDELHRRLRAAFPDEVK